MGDDKSVTVQGNNSGIIITSDYNTIHLNKENLLKKEIVSNTFKSYYQNHFKTISLLIEDEKKPIDDIYVNLAIIREEKEKKENKEEDEKKNKNTEDKSKLLDRDKIINSYEEIYKPKEPIAIEELIEKSSKSNSAKALIYGKAGIGKTTFCKYIAYRWAKGELYSEFENVVYIALREWKDGGLESVIKKIHFEEKHKESAIEIEQSKMLFLFDGYDELSDTSLLHNAIKKYNLQNYIITSRPYGYRKSDFDVNEVFETIGFTDENVTAYIDKSFTEPNHKTNLQNFLKQNINIKHIAYIPLMLEMICSLWREKANNNQSFLSRMTMTELYSEVVNDILSKYARRKKYEEVYKRKYKKDIFLYLGKIAFEALKKQTIVIDGEILEDVIENIKTDDEDDFLEKKIFYTGFLKSNNKSEDPWSNSYQFPHLTFQEYFSALYVSKLPKDEISEIVRDYKFYPYMQVFFAFLGGLIEDKEFLLREIESEPKDEVGLYHFYFILIILSEMKKDDLNENRIENINNNLIFFSKENQLNNKKLKTINHFINNNFIDSQIKLLHDKHINSAEAKMIAEADLLSIRSIDNEVLNKILDKHIYFLKKPREYPFFSREEVIASIVRNDKNNIIVVDIMKNGLISKIEGAKSLASKINTKMISILIDTIKNEKISLYDKQSIAESLVSIGISDDKIVDILIDSIKYNNLYTLSAKNIIRLIISIRRTDEQFTNKLINFVEDEDIKLWYKTDIAKLLVFKGHNVDGLINIDIMIDILKNKDIYSLYRKDVAELLVIIGSSNPKTINIFIDMIKNALIGSVEIAKSLSLIGKNNDKIINILIQFISDRSIDSWDRKDVAKLLATIGQSNIKVINALIDFIQESDICFLNKRDVAKSLVDIDKNNDKVVDILIELIQNKNIDVSMRVSIIESFETIGRSDEKILNTIVDFIEDKNNEYNIDIALKVLFKLTFTKTSIYEKININKHSEIFIKNSSIKDCFEAFNNGYIELNIVIKNTLHNVLPLYLKNKSLCTIYENQEIQTQREVSLEEIERVKRKLGLIKLYKRG